MSPRLHRRKPRTHSPSRTILALFAGVTLLAPPTAANAFTFTMPSQAEVPASEDCCGTDEGHTFRGYTVELWDEAPTISELACPDQDDECLIAEVDQISRLTHLQAALVRRAAFVRAQHFGEEPLVAGDFSLR